MLVTEQTGSFIANYSDGLSVKVIIFTEFLIVTETSGQQRRIPRIQYLRTAEGRQVTFVEPGMFHVVETGDLVTTDDPAAPQGEAGL